MIVSRNINDIKIKEHEMIKFIVTDMDGTLVDSKKELHPETIIYIKKLIQQGIRFGVASGRQFQNLDLHFNDIKEDIILISDNGTIIHDGLEKIYVDEMNNDDVIDFLEFARNIPNTDIVLCGVNSAYIENSNTRVEAVVNKYYESLTIVDNFESILHTDQICKISIYDWIDAESNAYPIIKNSKYSFSINLSGERWVDIMNNNASKGHAIKIIQEKYSIEKKECMAFGDYLNDYTMMLECGETYAMKNAHPKLKSICKYEAPSNDDAGVVQVLKREFNL